MKTSHQPPKNQTCIVACGALAKEIKILISQLPNADSFHLTCLPAILHNHPDKIPPLLDEKLHKISQSKKYSQILVAYADCGTGGRIAKVCEKYHVPWIQSPHCYAFFATHDTFDTISQQEIGSFYLTDYLVSHFDRLIIQGLGIDTHPQLRDTFFKHYVQLVYLAQNPTPSLEKKAQEAAKKLKLSYAMHVTGYGDLAHFIQQEHTS